MKRVFQTAGRRRDLRRIGHRRVGSGAGQHAVARRSRADVRDRPVRDAVEAAGRAPRARRRVRSRATGGTARTPARSRRGCAPTPAHAIKAVCVVHNETSTGVTTRIPPMREAIDRAGHPALLMVDTISSLGSIDYRHDEWGVDVTVAGSQKGPDAAAGAVVQRDQRQGARGVARRRSCRARTGTGTDMLAMQHDRLFPVHARDQPALRAARGARHAARGRPRRTCSRGTTRFGRSDAARGARVGPRDPVRAIRPSTARR